MKGPLTFLLLFGLPLLELYILVKVGTIIGAWPTILAVIVTAVAGSFVMRWQGATTLWRVRETMNRSEMPAQEMLEGAMLIVGGVLLIAPGFITDVLGIICLIPPVRKVLASRLLIRLLHSSNIHVHIPGQSRDRRNGQDSSDGRTIEGDYTRREDDNEKND
jgi:UPF0716 protein FxsA